MSAPASRRVALRREAHDLKEAVEAFALFEALTILCTPPEEDEDD